MTSPGGTTARGSCRGPTCMRWAARPGGTGAYYQAFDVTLIPYRMDHPFNRACNPTKIMDAMGSGRPIVATAIPECRLHAERFDVAERRRRVHRRRRQNPRPALRRRPCRHASCVCPGQHVPRDRRANSRPDRSGLAWSGPGSIRPPRRWSCDGVARRWRQADGVARREAVNSIAARPGGHGSAAKATRSS